MQEHTLVYCGVYRCVPVLRVSQLSTSQAAKAYDCIAAVRIHVMTKSNPSHKEYVNQHWVPECYLTRFASSKGAIHVYDKVTGKSWIDTISRVASARHFYTIPEDLIRADARSSADTKMVEFVYRDTVEPEFNA